jgi:hypothetical protein
MFKHFVLKLWLAVVAVIIVILTLGAVGLYILLIAANKPNGDETGKESLKKDGLKPNTDN